MGWWLKPTASTQWLTLEVGCALPGPQHFAFQPPAPWGASTHTCAEGEHPSPLFRGRVLIPLLMDNLKDEPLRTQTRTVFIDAMASHPSTLGLNLVLKWMFQGYLFSFLFLKNKLIFQQSLSCLDSSSLPEEGPVLINSQFLLKIWHLCILSG